MKKHLLIVIAIVLCSVSYAQNFDQYLKRVYTTAKGNTLNYRILYPKDYDSTQTYPLILFLHGMGECGNDNQKQLTHGADMFLKPEVRDNYQAIVIFPQTPKEIHWIQKSHDRKGDQWGFLPKAKATPTLTMVTQLVHQCIKQMPIDPKRIYVMGLSMGAMGTFDIVCRNPKLFAAAIPICGGVNPQRLTKRLRGIKFRLYHGDKDFVVSTNYSRNAYKTLQEAGVNVEYFEFPGVDHGSWGVAFAQPDYLEWLFKQHR